MNPGIAPLMLGIVNTVSSRILPELNADSYATGDARMVAMLALLLAQETDRTADTLARENREMRGIFAIAAKTALDPALVSTLKDEIDGSETDLRISALSVVHDRLSEKLIRLHEAAEASDADWARALDREIWQLLLKGAESRALVMPVLG